jgi:hypothetical protein
MSGGIGTAVREAGNPIKFNGWDGLNEYEQMAAKAFEEGIENTRPSRLSCRLAGTALT